MDLSGMCLLHTINIKTDTANTVTASYMYLKDTLKNPLLHMALVFIAGANFRKLKDFLSRCRKKPTRREKRAKSTTKALKHLQKKLRTKNFPKERAKENSNPPKRPNKFQKDPAATETLTESTELILSERHSQNIP